MSDMKAAREAAAEAMTVALKNAADLVYWWDEADRQIISGGEPEWTEYAGGVKLADRFDLQAIANAAIDAFLGALEKTHAVVPREPTEAMIRAAFLGVPVPSADAMRWTAQSYRAMLKAAEQHTGEK